MTAAHKAGASAAGPLASADAPQAAWQGSNYTDIAAGWTRWLLSIPLGVSPLADTETGINCALNQSGPVWYLAAPGGVVYTRTCTLPAGKALVMPLSSYINDYPCADPTFQPPPGQSLEDFLRAGASFVVDGTTSAVATLDNKPLRLRRVSTGSFSFTAAGSLNALDSCLTGSPQLGVIDGLFVFIDPPSPGTHTLQVSVSNQFFGATVGTITLKVRK